MIPENVIKKLDTFAKKYSAIGYSHKFDRGELNKYQLCLSKNSLQIIIRDGYYDGRFDSAPIELTSFDVLFMVGDMVFAKYFSDYPLGEYETRLNEAFDLIKSFFDNNYTITNERSFIRKKLYLNINMGAKGEEHLLGMIRLNRDLPKAE